MASSAEPIGRSSSFYLNCGRCKGDIDVGPEAADEVESSRCAVCGRYRCNGCLEEMSSVSCDSCGLAVCDDSDECSSCCRECGRRICAVCIANPSAGSIRCTDCGDVVCDECLDTPAESEGGCRACTTETSSALPCVRKPLYINKCSTCSAAHVCSLCNDVVCDEHSVILRMTTEKIERISVPGQRRKTKRRRTLTKTSSRVCDLCAGDLSNLGFLSDAYSSE